MFGAVTCRTPSQTKDRQIVSVWQHGSMTHGDTRNAVATPVWKLADSTSRFTRCHAQNILDWKWACLKFRVQQMHCYIREALLSLRKVFCETKPQSEVWQDFSFLPFFPITHKTFITLSPKTTQWVSSSKHISSHVWIRTKESIKFFISGTDAKGNTSQWLFSCLLKPGDTAPTNIHRYGALKDKFHPGSHNTVNNKCCFILLLCGL